MKVRPGDRVEILAGDEKGSWGIVQLIQGDEYHVALYASDDIRVYKRRELRKNRIAGISPQERAKQLRMQLDSAHIPSWDASVSSRNRVPLVCVPRPGKAFPIKVWVYGDRIVVGSDQGIYFRVNSPAEAVKAIRKLRSISSEPTERSQMTDNPGVVDALVKFYAEDPDAFRDIPSERRAKEMIDLMTDAASKLENDSMELSTFISNVLRGLSPEDIEAVSRAIVE